MSKPRICKSCKWLHHRAEPCCWCSRWGKGKTDHYSPAEETLGEYLKRKEREEMGVMTTNEIIKNLELCRNSTHPDSCTKCTFASTKNCYSHLFGTTIKHIKFLEQELIDERDRYDRLVSSELAEAEALKAAKDMLGACMFKVLFADAPHQSTAVTAFPRGGKAFKVPSKYCDCDKAKLNEFYKIFKQHSIDTFRNGPDNVPRVPLITVEDLDKADDTVRRCAEYVAEKHLQEDEIEWLPPKNAGDYWRNICGINARQEAKGVAKYGRPLEANTTLSTEQRIEHAQEELIDALKYLEHLKAVTGDRLTANDYQRMAMRTAGEYDTDYDQLRNAAYGLNGEAGEVIDLLKKHEFQGHDLPAEKLIDECGDVLWYCALLADALGFTLEQVMNRNIDKLRKRYPEGFDKARSINREG